MFGKRKIEELEGKIKYYKYQIEDLQNAVSKEEAQLKEKYDNLTKALCDDYEKKKQALYNEIENREAMVDNRESNYKSKILKQLKDQEGILLKDKTSSFKWLSGMIADYLTLPIDNEISDMYSSRSEKKWDRGLKITDLKRDLKELIERNKVLEYELKYIYELYPEVEDAEIELEEYIVPDTLEESGWLTKEEWENLSSIEKNTLAFERYKNRHKTKWQIGRDFEMYIGYRCEHDKKYEVEYHGIENGKKDLGIDLIARKNNEVLIIQCKYWSKDKQIHEKHLCQLYGTTIKYQLEHPDIIAIPVFVCHNTLSDMAKNFAQKLGIEVHESIDLGDYPAIKCCDNQEKIYHLPFDINYDGIVNCRKVMTVEEAENAGYRRAFKWHGNNFVI